MACQRACVPRHPKGAALANSALGEKRKRAPCAASSAFSPRCLDERELPPWLARLQELRLLHVPSVCWAFGDAERWWEELC